MDLRTLRYFTVVAEELNITHAAERLCMSQPPLSNQMKALEEELGVKLFIRGKRQLQLTDAGRLLLLRATQILDMTEKAQREVMSLEGGMSGTINLGIVEGRAPFLIARWIAGCDVTRSVSKMTEIERRGGKRWDKPKKAEKSRDCGGGKF